MYWSEGSWMSIFREAIGAYNMRTEAYKMRTEVMRLK